MMTWAGWTVWVVTLLVLAVWIWAAKRGWDRVAAAEAELAEWRAVKGKGDGHLKSPIDRWTAGPSPYPPGVRGGGRGGVAGDGEGGERGV